MYCVLDSGHPKTPARFRERTASSCARFRRRAAAPHTAPSPSPARPRLVAVVDVLPRVDVDQQLILLDELVVVDGEGQHHAGNLRRNGDGAAVGIGVVGAFDVAGGEPVIEAAGDQQENDDRADGMTSGRRLLRAASSTSSCSTLSSPSGFFSLAFSPRGSGVRRLPPPSAVSSSFATAACRLPSAERRVGSRFAELASVSLPVTDIPLRARSCRNRPDTPETSPNSLLRNENQTHYFKI
jgi:hypothetical protein